jgi:hypothetical protein
MSQQWTGWKEEQLSENIREIKEEDGTLPPLLFNLLKLASPHGLEHHVANCFPFKKEGRFDAKGNFILKIGANPTTMFSCHMDTVHTVLEETLKTKKCAKLWLVTKDKTASVKETGYVWGALKKGLPAKGEKQKWDSLILGADDKAGCYILSEFIDNEVPGLYVFHVGEECGGIGSRHIVANTPELVKGIQRCVAFDRKGYGDVIEFQSPGRCASSEFCTAVAAALNANIDMVGPEYRYTAGVHGTFTDSACYRDLIPECINLSVGYFNQHSDREYLDAWWLTEKFIPTALLVDWDHLPTTRDPKAKEVQTNYYYHGNNHGYNANFKINRQLVKKDTPFQSCPLWNPNEPLPLDVSAEGLMRMIEATLWHANPERDMAVKLIAALVIECNFLKEQLNGAEIADEEPITEVATVEVEKPKEETFTAIVPKPEGSNILHLPLQGKDSKQPLLKLADVREAIRQKKPIIIEKIDNKGLPIDKDEFHKRFSTKVAVISTILQETGNVKLKGAKAQAFDHQEAKYRKIMNNLGKNTNGAITSKIYTVMNQVMVRILEVTDDLKMTDKMIGAYTMGVQYVKDNWYEDGIRPNT